MLDLTIFHLYGLTYLIVSLQVFIPVNMSNIHWYLMVINGTRREIQFLDSLACTVRENDIERRKDATNIVSI